MTLRRTALFERHQQLSAKLTDFGGWEMPLSYPSGTIAEHMACREHAAVFDVSHLGTVVVSGQGSFDRIQSALTNDLRKIGPGRAQYTHLVDPETAGVIDDIIVWWVSDEVFHVMPNASNTSNVVAAVGGEDITSSRVVLALQGPAAVEIAGHLDPTIDEMKRFRVAPFSFEGRDGFVATTGYTGELGVEFSVPNEIAPALFDAIIALGATPAGLGARDTLRLEAALPLHGHELSDEITPYEAGLSWVVALDKPAFRGRDALVRAAEDDTRRRLIGLRGTTRQPFRAESEITSLEGEALGVVTSGNFSPLLGCGIALGLVDRAVPLGSEVSVIQRGRTTSATVCELPFVSKRY
ncbi:MAG: glycine cleavage system aminomethyltransferase GcvT [Acidimicrobiales bacterium]